MSVLFAKRKTTSNVNSCVVKKSKVIETVSEPNISMPVIPQLLQTFEGLGISTWLSAKCNALGIKRPTPVQIHCIPAILAGRDVVGCAPTGSGKTAAFALPILHALSKDPYGPYAVVLTPTRELAFQIHEQFIAFGSAIGLKSVVVVGGVDMLRQSIALDAKPHVIIATPGRLRDHLTKATPPDLSQVAFVVLDEADRLLTDTFAKDLNAILSTCTAQNRQTLLFSATMNACVANFDKLLTNPLRFDATPTISTVDTLKQQYLFIPAQVKTVYLAHLLTPFAMTEEEEDKRNTIKHKRQLEALLNRNVLQKGPGRSVIVFVATCRMAQQISETLSELNVSNVSLHSVMSQARRLAALGKFKSGRTRVLICTDVASRGLDIPSVDLVINFDLPLKSTDYIHRVGRTARKGEKGESISFVTQYDIEVLRKIETDIDRIMEEYPLEEAVVLKRLNAVTVATRSSKLKMEEYGFNEKAQRARNRKRDARAKRDAKKQAE